MFPIRRFPIGQFVASKQIISLFPNWTILRSQTGQFAVPKQSPQKLAATNLALYLSSDEVQKEFALQTYTIPTAQNLKQDADILADPVITGFIEQAEL